MKKLSLIVLLAGLIVFISCGKDEDPANQITIDGQSVGLLNGYYVDFSSGGTRSAGASTTYRYFKLIDGTYQFDGILIDGCAGTCEIDVDIDAYSSGSTFSSGEFTVRDECAGSGTGNSIWVSAYNADNSIDVASKSGTIIISGNAPNYTITFDMVMYDFNDPINARQDGITTCNYNTVNVTGHFKKTFIEVDQSNLDG